MIKQIAVNGMNIEYWTAGQGQPLLFLHGAFGSFRFYLPLLELLAKNHEVIAPTLPGMGRSQSPEKGNLLAVYKTTLKYVIDHTLKDREYTLIGHSLGGSLALALNQDYLLNNKQLILIDPVGYKIRHYYLRTVIGWTTTIIDHLKHIDKLKFKEMIPWDAVNIVFLRPVSFFRIMKALKAEVITTRPLKNRHLKKFVIFTSRDDHYVLPSHAEYLHKLFPESKLKYIDKGGHCWFYYNNSSLLEEL